ncbi:hypothetical protein BaRGS_00016146 [Batillaria attramentaria]|uniref:Uncharacterized protein n=1 Tax=Batillaria attramentaria TaxID=370345 RepID=A0ABD0KZS3_9CAEN
MTPHRHRISESWCLRRNIVKPAQAEKAQKRNGNDLRNKSTQWKRWSKARSLGTRCERARPLAVSLSALVERLDPLEASSRPWERRLPCNASGFFGHSLWETTETRLGQTNTS